MAALSPYLRSLSDGLSFWCPGCRCAHRITLADGTGKGWSYNNDPVKPTFRPSVLLKTGHHATGGAAKDCWCDFEARLGRPSPFACSVCHSFITDGQIQFLADCTHHLAGETVPLPAFPSYVVE